MTLKFNYYAFSKKKNWVLPSEEVHEIIDKLCTANNLGQSKVTGILVEEALRSRGVLNDYFSKEPNNDNVFANENFDQGTYLNNNKPKNNHITYKLNEKSFSDDIKMIHEFIEYKYFKKVMKNNNNIFNN